MTGPQPVADYGTIPLSAIKAYRRQLESANAKFVRHYAVLPYVGLVQRCSHCLKWRRIQAFRKRAKVPFGVEPKCMPCFNTGRRLDWAPTPTTTTGPCKCCARPMGHVWPGEQGIAWEDFRCANKGCGVHWEDHRAKPVVCEVVHG